MKKDAGRYILGNLIRSTVRLLADDVECPGCGVCIPVSGGHGFETRPSALEAASAVKYAQEQFKTLLEAKPMAITYNQHFKNLNKLCRHFGGWRAVARETGIPYRTICKWWAGGRTPSKCYREWVRWIVTCWGL